MNVVYHAANEIDSLPYLQLGFQRSHCVRSYEEKFSVCFLFVNQALELIAMACRCQVITSFASVKFCSNQVVLPD